MNLPTPKVPTNIESAGVYPPSEDSFLLMDTLEQELDKIGKSQPACVLEICSGSGIVSTFFKKNIMPDCLVIATDITPCACKFAFRLSQLNSTQLDILVSDIGACLRGPFFDVILCNPPYVPSDSLVSDSCIDMAWRGGPHGMELFYRLLPVVSQLLNAKGIFICVLLRESFMAFASKRAAFIKAHFTALKVLKSRSTTLETLIVVEFIK
jgi:release factor glutamine methyltransferase